MKVALTFDAELPGQYHAHPEGARRILRALDREGVPATWFLQGRWCRLEPDTARAVASAGHLIGNHSMMHAPYPWLHADGMGRDLREAEVEIERATGMSGRPWFRAPNLLADLRVEQVLADKGYWPIGADVLSFDWHPDRPPEEVARAVTEGVSGQGPVVLMHNWPRSTHQALPIIFAELRGEADYVTVEDVR